MGAFLTPHPVFAILGHSNRLKFHNRLQGAADARRWARRRTFVLQAPDNKADAVPCERLHNFD